MLRRLLTGSAGRVPSSPHRQVRTIPRTRRVGQLCLLLGIVLLAVPAVGGTANAVPPSNVGANPDLPDACGIDVTLILDRSGSIDGSEDDVQDAAQSLVDAFADTGSRFKVVTFADTATGANSSGSQTSTLANIVFRDAEDVTIGAFNASGSTNWDDALEAVRRSPGAGGDLVVFVTDGNPTSRNDGSGGSGGNASLHNGHGNDVETDGSGASTSDGEIDEAMSEANWLKADGSHLFAIGVSGGINQTNLQRATGPDEYDGTPPPTINQADFTLLGDFDELAGAFRDVVTAVCGGTIEVVKQTAPDGSTQPFGFTLYDDQDVAQGSLVQADGDAAEAFAPVPPGTYSVEETAVAGWTLTSATCDDLGTQTEETVPASAVTVGPQETWRCTFANSANDGSITVVKSTVGDPTGSFDFTRSFGAGFQLDTVGGTAQVTFADLPVGEYAVAEASEPGWTLQSATCDEGETVEDIDVGPGEDITCTFVNAPVELGLSVTKAAAPTSLPEPGGPVTYTVTLQNTSPVSVTIDSITDSPFAIPGDSSCAALVGTTLAADDGDPGTTTDSATCTFTATIAGADAGDVIPDTVTVEGHRSDDPDQTVNDSASAEVTITDAPPTATAAKSPLPASVQAPGGPVTFTVRVTNTSLEVLFVSDMQDDIAGIGVVDPTTVGGVILSTTCTLGAELDPGELYECSFVASVSGAGGTSVDDTIEFTLYDDEENEVNPTADAAVTITTPPPPPPTTTTPPTTAPPVDECPDDPGFQTNPDQCTVPEVLPAEPVAPSVTPTPTTAAPQVQGEVVTRAPQQLPRTGTDAVPTVQIGLGLLLLGAGAMLAGKGRISAV
jgi:hypothetical protein